MSQWREQQHPRDTHGKFSERDGGGGIQITTRDADRNMVTTDVGVDLDVRGPSGRAPLTGQDAHDSVPKGLYKRGTMTPEQRKALQTYETGWFMVMNDVLRNDRQGDPDYADEERDIGRIDAAMIDSVLPDPIQAWRGLFNARTLFGDDFDGDLSGFAWHEKGYGSVTTNEDITRVFITGSTDPTRAPVPDAVKMTVDVSAGVRALQTSSYTKGSKANGPQAEITLQHDLVWTVVRDNGRDAEGTRLLEVSVTRPGEQSL